MEVIKKQKQHLKLDEAEHFLDVLNKTDLVNEDAKHLILLYLLTGLRRDELLNIEREDVNLSENFFRAINIKSRDKHKVWRPFDEDGILFKEFKYFLDKYPDKTYPFKICHPSTITHWTKKVLKEAGFEDLHLHSLRHTALTLGLENDMTLREVQLYADHSSENVTKIYAHDKSRKGLNLGIKFEK